MSTSASFKKPLKISARVEFFHVSSTIYEDVKMGTSKKAFNRFISKHITHDLHDTYFPKKVLYLGLYMNFYDQRI